MKIRTPSDKWIILERDTNHIITVLRTSDNKIFTIGSKVLPPKCKIIYTIYAFELPCYCEGGYDCKCCKRHDYSAESLGFNSYGGKYGFRGIVDDLILIKQ